MPRHLLLTGEDAKYSENLSSFLIARFADWTFSGDPLQLSVYLDLARMLLPDTGPDPDRSVNVSPRLSRQREIMLYEDGRRAIWMPERKMTVSSGNRRGELTNHIWYFKLGC